MIKNRIKTINAIGIKITILLLIRDNGIKQVIISKLRNNPIKTG